MKERVRQSFARTSLGIHLLLLLILLFILGWLSLSSLLFFSNDTGLRFLQTRSLIEQGWESFAVPYPGQIYDADFRHVPYYYAYVVIDGNLFVSISPFFPLLLSGFYAFLGRAGLVLVVISSGAATALALHWLAVQSALKRPLLVFWSAVLSTPLLFYSLTLWDHGLATALALGSVVAVVAGHQRSRPFYLLVAGALAAFASAQRAELALFAVALGAALFLASRLAWRSFLLYVIGGVAGFLPGALLNTVWVGHPFGIVIGEGFLHYWAPQYYPVAAYSGISLSPAIVTGRLLFYIQGADVVTFAATILALFAAVLLIFGLRLEKYRKRSVFVVSLVLMGAAYLLWLIQGWNDRVSGVLSTFPLFPLSFAYVEQKEESAGRFIYHLIFLTTVLFLVSMLLIWPSFGGNQWGARYLLPVYPLMLFLAWYSWQTYAPYFEERIRRVLAFTFAGLLALSILVQIVGVAWMFSHKYEQRPVRAALSTLPAEVILTNNPFLPSFHVPLEDKRFLYVDDTEDLEKLVPRFAANGVERFALVTVEGMPIHVPDRIGSITLHEIRSYLFELEER